MTPSHSSEDARLHARDPETIRRLINNQHHQHTPHAFRAGHAGMYDFNRLVPVLRSLPAEELEEWMKVIDTMCSSHVGCLPCSSKILVYSYLITKDILPVRSARYKRLYEQRIQRFTPPEGRNYLQEVINALKQAPEGPEGRAHKINWLVTLEDLLAHQQRGG